MSRKSQDISQVTSKTCRECQEVKDISCFTLRGDRKGYRPDCGTCMSRKKSKTPAFQRAQFKCVLWNKYGITVAEFEQMLVDQQQVCAICKGPAKAYSRLFVDHCHATGNVRGLLCNTCNAGLGQFGDSIELLEAAVAYLKKGVE